MTAHRQVKLRYKPRFLENFEFTYSELLRVVVFDIVTRILRTTQINSTTQLASYTQITCAFYSIIYKIVYARYTFYAFTNNIERGKIKIPR